MQSSGDTAKELGFKGRFHLGDRIKALDFAPGLGAADSYLVGVIVELDRFVAGALAYKIIVEEDTLLDAQRAGEVAYVQYQLAYLEHPDRVTLVVTH